MGLTEILANQHFIGLSELANELNINIKYYSTKTSARKVIHEELKRQFTAITLGRMPY
jgi:ATP-dependent DNA helicase RecG